MAPDWIEKQKYWFASVRLLLSLFYTVQFLKQYLHPWPECLATENINHPIYLTELTKSHTNTTSLFQMIMVLGTVTSCIAVAQSTYQICAPRKHGKLAALSTSIVVIITLAFVMWCTQVRFSHAGGVCAGDYLYEGRGVLFY
jgi:hypothetical protein